MRHAAALRSVGTMTITEPTDVEISDVDTAATEEFAFKLVETITGSLLTSLIGSAAARGGSSCAAAGPATSEELAERGGLQERYVREWLGRQWATAGIFEYDAENRRVWLDGRARRRPHGVIRTTTSRLWRTSLRDHPAERGGGHLLREGGVACHGRRTCRRCTT